MGMGAATPAPLSVPVLVVSGNDVLRTVVRMRLETAAGYVLAEAASAASAIAYLHFADGPHIVMLDLHLPRRTVELILHVVGLDAALQRHRYLLAASSNSSTRFTEELRRLIKTYGTAFVHKPFGLSLLTAIEQVAAQLPAPISNR